MNRGISLTGIFGDRLAKKGSHPQGGKTGLRKIPALVLLLTLLLLTGVPAQAQLVEIRYFPETGHNLYGAFLQKYQSAADPLLLYGYPLTEQFARPDGQVVQYFQRARFELRPELPAGQQVQLTSLGRQLYTPGAPLNGYDTSACQYFAETGFWVCFSFLQFFNQYGGAAQFGAPISSFEFQDDLIVQYFEKARLEWHPERPEGQRVALSDLGRLYFDRLGEDPGLFAAVPALDAPPAAAPQPVIPTSAPPAAPPPPVVDPSRVDYFTETGHRLSGEFLQFYYRAGDPGLLYGDPITEPFTSRDGNLVQYFQRARFELPAGQGVRVTPLGRQLHTPGGELNLHTGQCQYFESAGYWVCFDFLEFFNRYGGLAQFGLPVSPFEFKDGLIVQYFENARFEWRPFNAEEKVGLTGLGRPYFDALGEDPGYLLPVSASGEPLATATATPTAVLPELPGVTPAPPEPLPVEPTATAAPPEPAPLEPTATPVTPEPLPVDPVTTAPPVETSPVEPAPIQTEPPVVEPTQPAPQPVLPPVTYGPNQGDFPAGINPLTGQPFADPGSASLPAVLLSVSHFPPSARPQAGLSFSPWVFETYIGEGATRFLAAFYGSFPYPEAVPGGNCAIRTTPFIKNGTVLGNRVWWDRNTNGVQDVGEPGIGGVCVNLLDAASGALLQQTSSDSNGAYGFNLQPGQPVVLQFSAPTGMAFTTPNLGNEDQDSDADPLTGRSEALSPAADDLLRDAGLVLPAGTNPPPVTVSSQVGPVRSGRLVYIYIQNFFQNSCLVYAGASPEVAARLPKCAQSFGSDSGAGSLMDITRLRAIAEDNARRQGSNFNYANNLFSDSAPGGQAVRTLKIYYHLYDQAKWEYDPLYGAWLRYVDDGDGRGILHPDTDRLNKRWLYFENVIVLMADHKATTPTLIDIDLDIGASGDAYLFRDGLVTRIRWSTRAGAYEQQTGLRRPIAFLDLNGSPVALKPGRTWVHVITPYSGMYEETPGVWKMRFYP